MRLIDADMIQYEEEENIDGYVYSSYVRESYINSLPTIDAVPTIHAKWVHLENHRDCEGCIFSTYECSNCKTNVGEIYDTQDLMNFCGSCGARMDD